MEKLQKTHTRWLKISSHDYKNCRWDFLLKNEQTLHHHHHHHHHTVKSKCLWMSMFWGFCTVAVNFCDFFCWTGMRPCGWWVCFCHCPAIGKIPVSSQSFSRSVQALCSIMWCWLLASSVGWGFYNHLMYFMVLERVVFYWKLTFLLFMLFKVIVYVMVFREFLEPNVHFMLRIF